VRRLIAVPAGWFVVACASAGQPPGGPEDHDPPVILSVKPDSGQLNVRPGQIDFQFDEVVAQQALRGRLVEAVSRLAAQRDPDVVASQRIASNFRAVFGQHRVRRDDVPQSRRPARQRCRRRDDHLLRGRRSAIRHAIHVFDWGGAAGVPNAYVSDVAVDHAQVRRRERHHGHFEIGPLDTGTYLVRGLIDRIRIIKSI
jgi:hypothetical protein